MSRGYRDNIDQKSEVFLDPLTLFLTLGGLTTGPSRRKAAQHPQLAGKLREAPGSSGKRREASAAPDSVRELRK